MDQPGKGNNMFHIDLKAAAISILITVIVIIIQVVYDLWKSKNSTDL